MTTPELHRVTEANGTIVLGVDVFDAHSFRRPSALSSVLSGVRRAVVSRHGKSEHEAEALESKVGQGALDVSRSFVGREEKGGENAQALSD